MSDTDPIWSPSLSHPAAMRAHIISAHLSDRDGVVEVDLVPDSPLSQHAPKLLEAAQAIREAYAMHGRTLETAAYMDPPFETLVDAIKHCRGEA